MKTRTFGAFTQAMVDAGDVYVEVYPMVSDEDGDTLTSIAKAEYFDISVRPESFDENTGTPYLEIEYIQTENAAQAEVEKIEAKYPGIAVNWIEGD